MVWKQKRQLCKEKFMNEIERDPQKYSDWSDKNWQVQTSGKRG